MIVVVADTSPLNYLSQINCDHVLPALYERVFVPAAVVEEPDDPKPVAAVRARLTRLPSWVVSVRNRQTDMLSSNGWMQHSCSSYGIAGSVSGKMASGPRKTGGAHVEYVAYAAKRYPPCTAENYLADRAMLRVVQMQLANHAFDAVRIALSEHSSEVIESLHGQELLGRNDVNDDRLAVL